MSVLLLPGMDGTGALYGPLCDLLPDAHALAYPPLPWGYDQLESWVRARCRQRVVVAESFSGPIGLRLANDPPPGLEAVVLVATFRRAPRLARLGARFGRWPFLWVPPAVAIRQVMVGHDAPNVLVQKVRHVLKTVAPDVLAARLRAVAQVNVPCVPKVPLVVLVADADRLVGPGTWPGADVRRVTGPHLLGQRNPETVAAVVGELLA